MKVLLSHVVSLPNFGLSRVSDCKWIFDSKNENRKGKRGFMVIDGWYREGLGSGGVSFGTPCLRFFCLVRCWSSLWCVFLRVVCRFFGMERWQMPFCRLPELDRDTLYLLLYIYFLERLAHDLAVRQGLWKPIQLSKNGPQLYHLFFADDLLLFAKAWMDQVPVIKACLESFCAVRKLVLLNPRSISKKTSLMVSLVQSVEVSVSPKQGTVGKFLGVPVTPWSSDKSHIPWYC